MLLLGNISRKHAVTVLEVLIALLGISTIWVVLAYIWAPNGAIKKLTSVILSNEPADQITQITDHSEATSFTNANCQVWNCMNLYRCGSKGHDRLAIYIYPLQRYLITDTGSKIQILSKEYYQLLTIIQRSNYYTENPNHACLFVSPIDILNGNALEPRLVNCALASLSYWEMGENHIIFNIIPNRSNKIGNESAIFTENAIVIGSGMSKHDYRPLFDVSLPTWSPLLHYYDVDPTTVQRDYVIVSAQQNIARSQQQMLQNIQQEYGSNKILVLQYCPATEHPQIKSNIRCSSEASHKTYTYPNIYGNSIFCLLLRNVHLNQQAEFLEMLAHNCIPIVAVDSMVLPFEDVLDWSLGIVRIQESEFPMLINKIKTISTMRITEMQHHGRWLYSQYFKDLKTITLTALQILEERIFPHTARSINEWNRADGYYFDSNPIFLPIIASKAKGFTAVILTYDRIESLFALIKKLNLVPSLQSIIVLWNNQQKQSPPISAYPSTTKSLKVIQTNANKLSNRFFPYAEIETEAILTLDDDILMLTADELEFGFEVWREFPYRIVGFPSRIHVWNNESLHWQYESEWTNKISMVLTGASFHHKIWNHLYTYSMPKAIKNWVDDHMNCEDIAMNFLVANTTKCPPIKVTPRKKFKCPECKNTEMLSADLNHMRERSLCIDNFAQMYDNMPLITIEFRADPVLYRDNFPEKLKRFNDIGTL